MKKERIRKKQYFARLFSKKTKPRTSELRIREVAEEISFVEAVDRASKKGASVYSYKLV